MEIANQSRLHLPPLCFTAASAECRLRRHGRPQATSCFPHRLTWHLRKPLDPLSLALDPSFPRHATPTSSAAATSPSPWTARCRASPPQLTRASVPGAIPFHFPLLASPAPCPEPPEHRRRPPKRRRARSSPSPRTSATAPPALTPPLVLPESRAAPRLLRTSNPSPQHGRRRAPPFFSAAVALLAVDHLTLTIPDSSKHTIRCALTSSCSPVSFPSPPATSLAGIWPVKPSPLALTPAKGMLARI